MFLVSHISFCLCLRMENISYEQILYFFSCVFGWGHELNLRVVRRGKTGGSGRVRVGSIGFAGQTGHGSKRVFFKRVNRVTGQSGFGSGRVDPYFSNFFFFFFNYKKTNIKLKRLRKKSNSH